MKVAEIRELRDNELAEKLDEFERQLFNLRCQSVTENMVDSRAVGNMRKNIARIKTVIRERELNAR
jgi:large subunit ribosomal protein L29